MEINNDSFSDKTNETLSAGTLDIFCKLFGIPLAVCILILNSIFIIVILRVKQCSSTIITTNLAINDILSGITLALGFALEPVYYTLEGRKNYIYCKLWAVCQMLPIYQQFTLILLLIIDRFIAVSFPANYADKFTKRRIRQVCLFLWVFELCFGIILLCLNGVLEEDAGCDVLVLSPRGLVSVLTAHIMLALIVTVVLCISMKHVLNLHQLKIQVTNTITYDKLLGDISRAKIYFIVMVITFILWCPLLTCTVVYLINAMWDITRTLLRMFLLIGYISSLRCLVFTFCLAEFKSSLLGLVLKNKVQIQTRPVSSL